MRIISICPSNTELVHFLGKTSDLIAIDDFSDWPKEVQDLPRLGPDLSINMDKVEELKPDLVLASLSVPGMEKNVAELEDRKIPYVVYNPQSLKDIQQDLLDLGERTNTQAEAARIVQWMEGTVNQYKKISASVSSTKKIYFEWWPKPVFTPGEINWLTEIAALAGCENIFSDVKLASVQTTWEDVLSRQPDLAAMVWVGVKTEKMQPAHIKKRPGWEKLQANNCKIILLEEALFCRPSPRLIFGLKRLAAMVHPESYPEWSLVNEEEQIQKASDYVV
jgi:iron complex transport system substrate-binding protein